LQANKSQLLDGARPTPKRVDELSVNFSSRFQINHKKKGLRFIAQAFLLIGVELNARLS